jgi:hypothetical protein
MIGPSATTIKVAYPATMTDTMDPARWPLALGATINREMNIE